MSFQLICGGFGCGKSTYITEKIKQLNLCGEKSVLIVPEQYSHAAEVSLVEAVGYICDSVRATSFKRFAHGVFKSLGMDGKYIDSLGKSMIMSGILCRLSGKLTILAGAEEKDGFCELLINTISEYKRAGLSPADLYEYAQNQCGSELLKAKLCDAALVYREYERLIGESFYDTDDDLTRLKSVINKTDKNVHIFIDEFFRFTKQETDIIEEFLKNGNDVTVCLSLPRGEENSISFISVGRTKKILTDLARDVGADISDTVYLDTAYRFESSPELLHLTKNCLKMPFDTYPEATDRLRLFLCSTQYSEVVNLAVNIKRLVAEEGYRYSDIAVIAGCTDRYSTLIKSIFEIYEIPVFTDDTSSLSAHPVMALVLSVIDVIADGFNTEDVMSYIKSFYSPLDTEEVYELENFAVNSGIRGRDWLNEERFLSRADSIFAESEELDGEYKIRLTEIKNKALMPIIELKKELMSDKTIRMRTEAIYNFLTKIGLKEKIQEETERFRKENNLRLAEEYAQVYNLLISLLDQLVLCLGEDKIGLKRFKAIISSGLSAGSVAVIPTSCDQVFFGDINRSLIKNIKAVFIIGANEGEYPAVLPAGGIFDESEREQLINAGFSLAPCVKTLAFDMQYLLLCSLSLAAQRLYISYPISDDDAKGMRPASVVGKIKKIFPRLKTGNDLLYSSENPAYYIASKRSAFRFLTSGINSKDPFCRSILNLLEEDGDYKNEIENFIRLSEYKNSSEQLNTANVKGLYGNNLYGSVSRFERFEECPFSFFIQYGLKAKEQRTLSIDAPDIGSLLHDIIDSFSRSVYGSGSSFREVTKESAEKIIDEIIESKTSRMYIKNLYSENKLNALLKRLKRLALRSVWAICTHVRQGQFEPFAFEAAFDENGNLPPVKIELPTGDTLTLVGRIDRIDKLERNGNIYLKIIDYKSGSKNFRLEDIYSHLSLQLLVYAIAACDNEKTVPAGVFYFRLIDPIASSPDEDILKRYKMSGLVLEEEDIIHAMDSGMSSKSDIIPVSFNADGSFSKIGNSSATLKQFMILKDYVKRTVSDIGKEIISGNTRILPYVNGKQTPCSYCKFKSICRIDDEDERRELICPKEKSEMWAKMSSDNAY